MTFEELEGWRKIMGYTIGKACEELGISWETWTKYRDGRTIPEALAVLCMARYHRMLPWPGRSLT